MAAGASVVLLARFSPSRFLDAARRHGATEFNMIGAMLEMLMRQPERPDDADNPLRALLHGPVADRGAPARDRGALRHRDRVRLRAVGDALRHVLGARRRGPYDTLGVGPPAPDARPHQRRPRDGRRRRGRAGEIGELELRNPAIDARLLRHARGDRRGARRRLAAAPATSCAQRGRDLHVRRPQEGGDPAAGREPRAGRGRGGARRAPRHPRGRGRSPCPPTSSRTT